MTVATKVGMTVRTLIVAGAVACFASCDTGVDGQQFMAKGAHMGKWEDKRPSGSIIMQDMLVLDEPRLIGSQGVPNGFYVITTSGRMATKIDDVVNDRIPVNRGTRLNFAVGDAVDVRIEKAVSSGKRQDVSAARASFLEIVR